MADAGPQLYSHLRGGLNLGASADALAETLAVAARFMDDARSEAARATLRRVLSRRGGVRREERDGGKCGDRHADEAAGPGGAEE